MKFYQRKLFWVIFIIVFSVILSRYFKISIHDEGYGRGWYFGDTHSAKNVETSAKYYLDSGFAKNSGLPYYGYDDGIENNEYVYTHYPPMAEWIAGAFATLTGHWQAHYISIMPLVLSVCLFFLIFHFSGQLLPDKNAGFISACIIVLSVYFLAWADDIHQHLYNEFFKWSFVLIWWRYLKFNTSKFNIVLLAILYLMMCLISFEPYVYIAIVVVGMSYVIQKKWISPEIVLLLAIPLVAFSIRLYMNANYFGSMEAMIADMKGAFVNRTGGENAQSELGRAMNWKDYLITLPKTRFQRLGHFYLFPSVVIFIIGILGIRKIKNTDKELFKVAAVIYIACVSWIVAMPQHALIHIFTLRHMAVFLSIVLGYGIIEYYGIVKKHFLASKKGWIAVHAVLILYTTMYTILNTVYVMYMKYGLFYPHLGKENYDIINSIFF